MIHKSIKDVFEDHLKGLKVDKRFCDEFQSYLMSVIAKDDEHVAFLASTYIGLNRVVFSRDDKNNLWNNLLDADRDDLADDLHHIPNPNFRKSGAKDSKYEYLVLREWKVGGDVTNHALMYLIHLALVNKSLDGKVKERFIKNVLILMQYKFLTGFLRNDFKFTPRRDIVLAAYNELNRKFLIKQVNSWKEYFNTRAESMYEGDGNRKDMLGILKSYNDHRSIINTITGISNNLRDMMNAYNKVFYDIYKNDSGLSLTSPIVSNSEGETSLRESLESPERHLMYIRSKIGIESEFIKEDLLSILVSGTSVRYIPTLTVLKYINENYGQRKQDDIASYVEKSVVFALQALSYKKTGIDNIGEVFRTVLGSISARRSADPDLEELRKLGQAIAKRALPNNNDTSTIMNVISCYLLIYALRQNKN